MNIFIFENQKLTLNKEQILLIPEFAALWHADRNKIEGDSRGLEKKRAFREFTYIYLMYDWGSPYTNFSDRERHETAMSDSMLTKKQIDDPEFKAACKKYQDIQETRLYKLLRSSYKVVDELRLFYETVDLQERDIDGKPIFNATQVMASLNGLSKTLKSLEEVEEMVAKEREGEGSKLRGDAKPGLFD